MKYTLDEYKKKFHDDSGVVMMKFWDKSPQVLTTWRGDGSVFYVIDKEHLRVQDKNIITLKGQFMTKNEEKELKLLFSKVDRMEKSAADAEARAEGMTGISGFFARSKAKKFRRKAFCLMRDYEAAACRISYGLEQIMFIFAIGLMIFVGVLAFCVYGWIVCKTCNDLSKSIEESEK